LTGTQGSGKTTLAEILLNELKIDDADVLRINASDKTGVDYIRDTILSFASTYPIGKFKVVKLEECLHEDTLVWVYRDDKQQQIKICELNTEIDLVKTFNIELNRVEWKSFDLLDKGDQELIEISLEDGSVIICTVDHKWFVEDPITLQPIVVKTSDLNKYEHILSFNETKEFSWATSIQNNDD
jgi:DNA polymerase III gamma/tau subunit